MVPAPPHIRRSFDPGSTSRELRDQWQNPSDVFSVLLILGGDVVARAQAQLAGSLITPVAFSFGWVAYAVTALVSAVGENKLMPLPDTACKVINGKNGYVRDNSSWIIGRIVRDFDDWMDDGDEEGPIHTCLNNMIESAWAFEKDKAEKKLAGSGHTITRPMQVGLCVSVYRAQQAIPGFAGRDRSYYTGLATSVLQLGIASIPCGIYGDWGILLITACGILLSFAMGAIGQWKREKWSCRLNSDKTHVLTKGNGTQHAIVIIGDGKGLDFESLATGPSSVNVTTSLTTRIQVIVLAFLWIVLLITASGLTQNTWFLLAVGGIGILQNIYAAAAPRSPESYGVPLVFDRVIGYPKVMKTLFAVEEIYPNVGRSMLDTFFPGRLRDDETKKWADLQKIADGQH